MTDILSGHPSWNRFACSLIVAAFGIAISCDGIAQRYPAHPVRIITGGAGGGSDFTARLIASGLTASLGQQVVVDNRASGVLPAELVAKAPADGHTLLVISNTLWLSPLLQTTPFDPMRDFSPVTLTNRAPNILVVHPSLIVHDVRGLISLARARPGSLSYSSGSTGASSHLAAEMFKVLAQVDIVRIPYKSGATEIVDLLSGQVHLTFGTAPSVMQYVKSGKLHGLAVTSARPFSLAPDLPTVAAAGLPGYESETVAGLLAPAKTPAAIVARLHQDVSQFLSRPEVRDRFAATGVEAVGGTQQQFTAVMQSEIERMGVIIRRAGIRAD